MLAPWLVSVKRATPVSTVTSTSWVAGAPGGRSGVVAVELIDPGLTGAAGWGASTPAGGALELGAGSDTSEGGGGGTGAKKIDQSTTTTNDRTIARTARFSILPSSYWGAVTGRDRKIYSTA